MQIETVQEMLRSYRQNIGRRDYLAVRIKQMENHIANMTREITESEAIKAQQYSDMPHGSTVGDPTSSLAIRLASGVINDDISAIHKELARLNREHRGVSLSISCVDAWLNGLNPREEWVIRKHVIDDLCWRMVLPAYKREFGEEYSKHTLQKLKSHAMSKIVAMAT